MGVSKGTKEGQEGTSKASSPLMRKKSDKGGYKRERKG